MDAFVYQRTVYYPDELALGFHVLIDDGEWVAVRQEQIDQTRWQGRLDSLA